jgi:hypothetical protein
MSKKFFFIGVAALLSASLFMLGCSSDDNDGPTPAQQAATLAGKLNGITTGTAVVNGATVTLSANVSLTETTTVVPAGVTLAVPSGKTLTVPSGKTLSVSGSVVLGNAADAKVILHADAVLNVAATGGLFSGNSGNDQAKVTITVAASGGATATKAKATVGDNPYWIITSTTTETGDDISSNKIVLGRLTLDFDGTSNVNGDPCAASGSAAAGRLKAGTGTVITFGGPSD